jgi:hypothetical protein
MPLKYGVQERFKMKKGLLFFIYAFIFILTTSSFGQQSNEKPLYRFSVKVFIDKQTADFRGGEEAITHILHELFASMNAVYSNQTVPLKGNYEFYIHGDVVIYDQNRNDTHQSIPNRAERDYDYAAVFDGLRNYGEESVSSAGWAAMGSKQYVSVHRSAITHDPGWPEGSLTTTAHEFGHMRGARDLYPFDVTSANNPVNDMSFQAMTCIMGSNSRLNQFGSYNRWIVDMTKDMMVSRDNQNVVGDPRWIINNAMQPDSILFVTRRGNKPVRSRIKLYHFSSGNYEEAYFFERTTNSEGELLVTWGDVFMRNGSEIGRPTLLVETTDLERGERSYSWMTKYGVETSYVVEGMNTHVQINQYLRDEPQRFYVRAGGTGTGESWGKAIDLTPDFVASLRHGDVLWVAKGTYNVSLSLPGIEMYGGFNGDETLLSQRNWAENPTILDGKVAYNTIIDQLGDDPLLVDGFIIQNGTDGGVNLRSNGTVRNCIIRNNVRDGRWAVGGGVFVQNANNGHATIENCLIINNDAYRNGGGVGFGPPDGTSLRIINTTIANNRVTGIPEHIGFGAGIAFPVIPQCYLKMYNTIIYNNQNLSGKVSSLGTNTATRKGVVELYHSAFDGTLYNFTSVDMVSCIGDMSVSKSPGFIINTAEVGMLDDISGFNDVDFGLASGSVCIDAGNNSYTDMTSDLAFGPRVIGRTIDMGAYESEFSTNIHLATPRDKSFKVVVRENMFFISGLEGTELVSLYSIQGSLLDQKLVSGSDIAMPVPAKGVYILLVDQQAIKLVNP